MLAGYNLSLDIETCPVKLHFISVQNFLLLKNAFSLKSGVVIFFLWTTGREFFETPNNEINERFFPCDILTTVDCLSPTLSITCLLDDISLVCKS